MTEDLRLPISPATFTNHRTSWAQRDVGSAVILYDFLRYGEDFKRGQLRAGQSDLFRGRGRRPRKHSSRGHGDLLSSPAAVRASTARPISVYRLPWPGGGEFLQLSELLARARRVRAVRREFQIRPQ